ncbi:MAG: AMP-binding protein [Prevotella sp.]|nr:AMP-binding protein [Prevotella sp.]
MTLEEFLTEWNDGNERLLVHTSGSTGQPKPLWVEKVRMLASARMTCDFLGLKNGDTALLCMPLDYIAGKMMVVRSLDRGLKLINVEPSGHPLKAIPFCSNGEGKIIDFAAMVPLQVWNSLQVAAEREELRQVRHLLIGGGAIDKRMAEALHDFPYAVWSSYGMTETLSHIALRRLNGPESSEWYTPLPGVNVSLGEEGCLMIEAPLVCAERLVTNDLAEIRETHSSGSSSVEFRILGRRDNVVCTGGVKIQTEEVERKLADHISVPFLITKRRDEKFGEVVVMLYEGSNDESLRAICQQVLPKYEQPRQFISVIHLPLTETGKPARKEAERIAEGK